MTVDVSTNVDIVTVDTSSPMFVLTVCASYDGRGLDGRSLSKRFDGYKSDYLILNDKSNVI